MTDPEDLAGDVEELQAEAREGGPRVDLPKVFGYHRPPNGEVSARHGEVRASCLKLAARLEELMPGCPEATLAVRHVQQAMMFANSAIAQHPFRDTVSGVTPMQPPR